MDSNQEILQILDQIFQDENTRSKSIECIICVEKLPKRHFQTITGKCSHNRDICNACANKHISSKMSEKGETLVYCPYVDCGKPLEHGDVKRLATKKVFERFVGLIFFPFYPFASKLPNPPIVSCSALM